MGETPTPEDILKSLEKGRLAPFYLFYGKGEFRLEKVLDKIRKDFLPERERDFNLEVLYGDKKSDPQEIIGRALSVPFMARNRLIIIRRTENFTADQLEKFIPYLENPIPSTCLIFVSSKTDFRKSFYKKIRSAGRAINFEELRDKQVVPWIRRTARDLGMNIEGEACAYLQHIVGNRLRDLHAELEKLYLRNGEAKVGLDEVKELAINSRSYTVFQLMDAISLKNCAGSLVILKRFLEEEDIRRAPLSIIGMLNRQIRLLWQTKSVLAKGSGVKEVAKKLNLLDFSAKNFINQAKYWSIKELEKGLALLYEADGLLKSSARPKPVLESLIVSLCTQGKL